MDASPHTVIVVAGGDPIDVSVRDRLPEGVPVIAADSGLDRAAELGLRVDAVVGDFDSVTAAGLGRAAAAGARIEAHPRDKEHIDLELALDAAVAERATRVVVVGGHGGRLDMVWATGLLLASPRYSGVEIEAFVGTGRVHVIRGGRGWTELSGRPGELLTLLPVHGPARGVRTEGLRFPLDAEDLPAGTTRGVSNELLRDRTRVALEEGTLLCVLPGEIG
ncbi:MAG: thiamine diphosphokinase [Acidimicrobiales bacterium]